MMSNQSPGQKRCEGFFHPPLSKILGCITDPSFFSLVTSFMAHHKLQFLCLSSFCQLGARTLVTSLQVNRFLDSHHPAIWWIILEHSSETWDPMTVLVTTLQLYPRLSADLGEINCIYYIWIRFSKFFLFSSSRTKDCKISVAFSLNF